MKHQWNVSGSETHNPEVRLRIGGADQQRQLKAVIEIRFQLQNSNLIHKNGRRGFALRGHGWSSHPDILVLQTGCVRPASHDGTMYVIGGGDTRAGVTMTPRESETATLCILFSC